MHKNPAYGLIKLSRSLCLWTPNKTAGPWWASYMRGTHLRRVSSEGSMLLYRYNIQRHAPQTIMVLVTVVVVSTGTCRWWLCCSLLLALPACWSLCYPYKPIYLERGQWVCTLWCGGSLGLCQVYVPEVLRPIAPIDLCQFANHNRLPLHNWQQLPATTTRAPGDGLLPRRE